MGRGSQATGRRRRGKAASASASAGLSKEAGLSAVSPRVPSCGDVLSGCKGIQAAAASASASASEERKILKHEPEDEEGGKILNLESLMLQSSEETLDDRQPKVLLFESEEDRKILMKVKSEEGKILKLKKEFIEASEKALAGVSEYIDVMPLVDPAAKKMMKKKMVVVRTLVPPAHIAFLKAMPCPVTSREINLYSEEELAYEPQSFQDYYREKMSVNMKMRDYHQALIDQYEKFGYAVDETELTDEDEDDEDEDNVVKN